MNVLLHMCVVMAVTATVNADDGPPNNWEQEHFWTSCVQDYPDPSGACHEHGFSVTTNPDGGYTKARQVDHWNDGRERCSDAPKRVRFFCSKKYTKAYWAGTAPACGSRSDQEENCRDRGYVATEFTSDFGDGAQCSWSGTKVLCAKE